MKYTIEIRPAARWEFDEAADWYRDESPDVRNRFVDSVEKSIISVTERPLSFPVVYGTRARRAVVEKFPYSIFFVIDGDRVFILSSFHDSRNPLIWRGRIS